MTDLPAHRITTGVSGLDAVTHGGWRRGGLYVVSGPPGTGKTVLGNQNCFAHLQRGGKAVLVTALTESNGRMVDHLQRLSFFDTNDLGQGLQYVSGYGVLRDEGLEAFKKMLFHVTRDHGATLLIVDGLSAIHQHAENASDYREFLHALAVHGGMAGCTTVLLTSRADIPSDPDHALVDGVVSLQIAHVGLRSIRLVEVTKFRGGPHMTGAHYYDIGDDGLVVFPRVETLFSSQQGDDVDPRDRLTIGIPELDRMFRGGLPRRSASLWIGSPGSGKTSLGLSFLAEGAARGEQGLYVGFSESAARLMTKAELIGLPLQAQVNAGRVVIEPRLPTAHLPDALGHRLLDLVQEHGVKRLFIDNLEAFAKDPIDDARTPRFIAALVGELRRRGVTSVLAQQTDALFGPELSVPIRGVETSLDILVLLRTVELRGRLTRLLSILKVRESEFDPTVRVVTLTGKGLELSHRVFARGITIRNLIESERSDAGAATSARAQGRELLRRWRRR